ncbi:MAG TPA: trimethylamine methyltransferase family protein, partial [Armatimonadota bacterium]|nr:trimethylamine methyltransferase family protein [Armatimonadota bacterium]
MPIRRLQGGQLKVLAEDDIRQIHEAVLEVMSTVGVRVGAPTDRGSRQEALGIYRDNGCEVDFEKQIVRMPEHVLNKALSTAPSEFTLYGKTPEYDVHVNLDDVYTIGGSSALTVLDLEGVRRPATLQDLNDLTRLLDGLENLHIMHALVVPQDIPQPGFDRILWATVMKNTNRNYYSQGQWAVSIRDQIEMAKVIQGSAEEIRRHPLFTIVICMMSPLIHSTERVDELIESARHGIPLYIEVDAMLGGTTPMTIAGTLVEECANVLTGIALAQFVNPGNPCIFSIASGLMNMSNGEYSGGAPETGLLHAATAQMAHFYGLPFQGGTGIDSTLPDAQAGYERALQVLTNALAGVNFVHLSIGMMEQMLLASYEQAVIDNEILGAAFRIVQGVEVTRDAIGLDVIKEVGIGGNYLAHDHTVKYMRPHTWFPKITNREQWTPWMASGGKDMRQRANERARRILAEHHPKPLTDEQEREIERIALDAQKKAVAQGPYTMSGAE